jgi:hypothetical protein
MFAFEDNSRDDGVTNFLFEDNSCSTVVQQLFNSCSTVVQQLFNSSTVVQQLFNSCSTVVQQLFNSCSSFHFSFLRFEILSFAVSKVDYV